MILGVTLLGVVAVAQNDIPLGDVARQQSGKKATHVYTDDNFKRTAPPPSTEDKTADTAQSDAGAKPAAKAEDKADAAPDDDLQALEKQLAELKQKRDITSQQVDRLKSSLETAGEGDIHDSLVENQAVYQTRLDELNAQIPVLEKQVEDARAAHQSEAADAAKEQSAPAEAKTDEKSE